MSDKIEQQQQPKSEKSSKKNEYKKKSYTRRVIKDEIAVLKDRVREAYAIGAKIEDGYEPTKEEADIVEEQALNNKLISKLEKLYLSQKSSASATLLQSTNKENHQQHHQNENMSQSSSTKNKNKKKSEGYVDFIRNETMTMLHFFYLVRLAQQGFFYLISGVYPTLEPQAITYLADKIIGTSIYAGRSTWNDRAPHLKTVSILVQNLMNSKDEPVAEGFKTTYKQIMDIIYHLMDQTLNEQQIKNKQESTTSSDATTVKKATPKSTAAIPPIWVVMPYSSMMDNQTFAMPGAVPTLPYPSTMLPNGFIPPNAVPFMPKPNPAEELRKSTTTNREAKEEETQEEEEEEQVKEEEHVAEQHEEQYVKQQQSHNYYYDDDDRFADPDMSDDEDDDNDEEEEEEEDPEYHEEKIKEKVITTSDAVEAISKDDKFQDTDTAIADKPTNTNESNNSNNSDEKAAAAAAAASAKANSSWSNYAASSRTESISSSPRSGRSSQQPYHKNKRY